MSSAPALLERLSLKCQGDHQHQPLVGGGRAAAAAIYPAELCRAILLGAEAQSQREGQGLPPVVGGRLDAGAACFALRAEGAGGASEALEVQEGLLEE